MNIIDLVVLISIIVIIFLIIGSYIYKKIKHIPTGECSSCSSKRDMNRMIKNVKKDLDKENQCSCNKCK